MLFSIDHGNSAIKTPDFVFTSGLTDYPIRPPVETDVLEFGDQFWTLSGQRIAYMRDKTKDDRFFILTLFAIAKELQQAGVTQSTPWKPDLAVGLPPEHYELRKRFAGYFQRGRMPFVFNNTPISLVIRGRPTIQPEDVKQTIFTTVRHYAANILDKLRELQVDLRANPAIFVGGGAVRDLYQGISPGGKGHLCSGPEGKRRRVQFAG